MTSEEKRAVLATARATLQRLNGGDAASNAVEAQDRQPLLAEVQRRLGELERRVAKPDPPQQERGGNLTDYEMARWRQYFEGHVAQAIATERDFMIEVVGLSLGERENQLREEIQQFVDAKFRHVPHGPPGERGETGPIGPQGGRFLGVRGEGDKGDPGGGPAGSGRGEPIRCKGEPESPARGEKGEGVARAAADRQGFVPTPCTMPAMRTCRRAVAGDQGYRSGAAARRLDLSCGRRRRRDHADGPQHL